MKKKQPMLARFQADPKKVRVSLRPVVVDKVPMWMVVVASRVDGRYVDTLCPNDSSAVNRAIDRLLRRAANKEIAGVDLGMQWSYDHPWKRELEPQD